MKTRQFVLIYTMNLFSIFMGIFIVGSEKKYGELYITNENFLSQVASLGGIFGALRFIWSFMLDKYSYKFIYGTLLVI